MGMPTKINNQYGFANMELNGGKGSGNWGHSGRPGEIGGSGSGKGSSKTKKEPKLKESDVYSEYGPGLRGKMGLHNWDSFRKAVKKMPPEDIEKLKKKVSKDLREALKEQASMKHLPEIERLVSKESLTKEDQKRLEKLNRDSENLRERCYALESIDQWLRFYEPGSDDED